MRKTVLLIALAWAVLLPCRVGAQQKAAIPISKSTIITDDVMMLTTPAVGLEALACCPYPASRALTAPAGWSVQIDWALAKHFGADTLQVLQLEIVKGNAAVAQFTLTFKPRQKPMTMQCMKGFGCEGVWEAYPWKSPNGNYLEHPQHKFRVTPGGAAFFTVQNLDDTAPITVRVNPCGTPALKKERKQ